MAKCIFHPNIQGYSGTIINKTHNFRERMKTVSNFTVGGTVKKKTSYSPNNSTGIPKNWNSFCLQQAWRIVRDNWFVLLQPANAVAYRTWEEEAMYWSATIDYNISTYQLFLGYFMTKYAEVFGSSKPYIYPKSLSAGTGLDYANRDTRQWIG